MTLHILVENKLSCLPDSEQRQGFSEFTVETLLGYGFLCLPEQTKRRLVVTRMNSTAKGMRAGLRTEEGCLVVFIVFILFLPQYLY